MWCLQETNYEHSNHILGGIFLQIHLLKASRKNLMPVAKEHDYCSCCKVGGKWYGFNCRLFSLGIYWHPWILEVKSVICHGTKNTHKVRSSSSKPRREIFALCRVWQQLCSAAKKFPYTSCTEVMPACLLGPQSPPASESCWKSNSKWPIGMGNVFCLRGEELQMAIPMQESKRFGWQTMEGPRICIDKKDFWCPFPKSWSHFCSSPSFLSGIE